jgi:hypothetical protein
MALHNKDFAAITKLDDDGGNYTDWAFRLEMVLSLREVQGYVKYGRTGRPPQEGTSADVSDDDRKNDTAARAIIVLALADSLLSVVRSCTTAKETWDVLADRFNSRSLSNVVFLRRKFINARMHKGDSMGAHLGKVKDLYHRLCSIGANIPESDLVLVILSSLPAEYDMLVVTFEARNIEELTYDVVATRLLHEERRHTEQRPSSSHKALAATDAPLPPPSRGNKAVTCFFCGRQGHIERECKRKMKESERAHDSIKSEHAHVASRRRGNNDNNKNKKKADTAATEEVLLVAFINDDTNTSASSSSSINDVNNARAASSSSATNDYTNTASSSSASTTSSKSATPRARRKFSQSRRSAAWSGARSAQRNAERSDFSPRARAERRCSPRSQHQVCV